MAWCAALSRCLGLWLLCSVVGCRIGEPDRTELRPYVGKGFKIAVRRDVLSNSSSPDLGVTLYDFHVGSLPLLFIYVGDEAGYPHFSWAAKREQQLALPSGLWAHCRYAELESGQARECLVVRSKTSPRHLLVFYDKLPPKWAKVADAIIDSIEAVEP